jgi:transglutaminase-like putative cysteine protease
VTTPHLGLHIRHHTGFTYDGLAKSSYNEARMTPLSSTNQDVHSTNISVIPNVSTASYVDYFDTVVTVFDLQENHSQLEVEARSSVTSRAATLEPPLDWREIRASSMADRLSEFLFVTNRTRLSGEPVELLEQWRGLGDVHECAEAVSDFVRSRVHYVPGATTVSSTAQEAWERGEGVCQDITHITVGLLRAAGVPTRYVSGYLFPPRDADVGVVVDGQSHAWVEYFSGSWTGIDPTNDSRETERHIIVGRGRDYDDVAPLKGIYHGPASSSLGVIVEMRRTD